MIHVHDHAAHFADDNVRHYLAAVVALALGAGPVGVFLMLRRMSLVGDAMSHSILPGVALGFLAAGMNVFAMTAGGLIAGLIIAVLAGVVSRATELKEDASFAVFLLVSLALGVVIVTATGIDLEELMHFLFGHTAAKMSAEKLIVIAANATLSTVALAVIYRPLVLDCVDPGFLRTVSRSGGAAHFVFLALIVVNLVSAFHALGSLLGVGIIIIPAAAARFWTRDITAMIAIAVLFALASGIAGVLVSLETSLSTGPAVTLLAGAIYLASVAVGRVDGMIWRWIPRRHLEA